MGYGSGLLGCELESHEPRHTQQSRAQKIDAAWFRGTTTLPIDVSPLEIPVDPPG